VKFNHLDHSGGGLRRHQHQLPASNIKGSGSKGSKKVIVPGVKRKPPSNANELRQRVVGFGHNAPQRQEKNLNKSRSAPSGSNMHKNRSPDRKASIQLNPKSGSQFKLNLKSGSQNTKSSLPSRSPIKLHKKPNSSRAKNELILRKSSSAHSSSRAIESPASSSPFVLPVRRQSALSRNEFGSSQGKEDKSQRPRMIGGKKPPLRLVSKHESEEKRQQEKRGEELLLQKKKKKRERREKQRDRERAERKEESEEGGEDEDEEERQHEHGKKKRKLKLRKKQQSEQSKEQLQSSSLSLSPHAKPSRSSVLSRDKRPVSTSTPVTKGIKPTRVSGLLKGSSIKGVVKGDKKSNNNSGTPLQAAQKAQKPGGMMHQSSRPQTKTKDRGSSYHAAGSTTRPVAPSTVVGFKPLPKSMVVPPPRPGVPARQVHAVPPMQFPRGPVFQRPPMVANPTFFGAAHQMAQFGGFPQHPQHQPTFQQQLPMNPLQMQRPGVAHIRPNVPQKFITSKGPQQQMRPHPVPHPSLQFAPPPRPAATAPRPASNQQVMASGLTFPLHAQITQYAALRQQAQAGGIVPPPQRPVAQHRFSSQGSGLNKGKGKK